MLLRQPRRVQLLAKLAATLSFAAVALAATEADTWIAARAIQLLAERAVDEFGVVLERNNVHW
jgi:hypothetical protein